MRPKTSAPTGRNPRVRSSVKAMSLSLLPNVVPIAVSVMTTRKKSNASRVQPRNPATTAGRWSEVVIAGTLLRVAQHVVEVVDAEHDVSDADPLVVAVHAMLRVRFFGLERVETVCDDAER